MARTRRLLDANVELKELGSDVSYLLHNIEYLYMLTQCATGTLWVTRLDEAMVSIRTVLESLRVFGPIERYFVPTPEDAAYFNIPYGGVFYQFARFKDCQEALAVSERMSTVSSIFAHSLQNMRQHRSYVFELSNFPENGMLEPSYGRPRRMPSDSLGLASAAVQRQSILPPSHPHSSGRAMDTCTILVDNLPAETSYYDLVHIFGTYGRILMINISLALPLVRQVNEQSMS